MLVSSRTGTVKMFNVAVQSRFFGRDGRTPHACCWQHLGVDTAPPFLEPVDVCRTSALSAHHLIRFHSRAVFHRQNFQSKARNTSSTSELLITWVEPHKNPSK